MRICVATNKGGLDDQVSTVFGRCQKFTIVDVEDKEIKNVEIEDNKSADAMGGAGIQAAQFIIDKKADAVIAGNYGPNAFPILQQAGVDAIIAQGNVKEIVIKYVNGELSKIDQPTAQLHRGMGMGGGGMGGGGMGGGGMGGGGMGGGGMGQGRGNRGGRMTAIQPQEQTQIMSPENKEEHIQLLQNQANQMEKQLKELKDKIDKLKK